MAFPSLDRHLAYVTRLKNSIVGTYSTSNASEAGLSVSKAARRVAEACSSQLLVLTPPRHNRDRDGHQRAGMYLPLRHLVQSHRLLHKLLLPVLPDRPLLCPGRAGPLEGSSAPARLLP